MNELYQQLQPQQLQMNSQQNELIQALKNSSNPESFVRNLILTNPQAKTIYNKYQQSGVTPKQFFYQYAQQNGLNPNQVLNSLR